MNNMDILLSWIHVKFPEIIKTWIWIEIFCQVSLGWGDFTMSFLVFSTALLQSKGTLARMPQFSGIRISIREHLSIGEVLFIKPRQGIYQVQLYLKCSIVQLYRQFWKALNPKIPKTQNWQLKSRNTKLGNEVEARHITTEIMGNISNCTEIVDEKIMNRRFYLISSYNAILKISQV